MFKLSLAALVLGLAVPAWSQQAPPNPTDRANRPGGTTQIAPSPGPATSPALASPTLPQAAVENREKARTAKAARKAQKKTAKPTKKSSTPARGPQSSSKKTTNVPSGTSKAPAQ